MACLPALRSGTAGAVTCEGRGTWDLACVDRPSARTGIDSIKKVPLVAVEGLEGEDDVDGSMVTLAAGTGFDEGVAECERSVALELLDLEVCFEASIICW